MHIYIIERWVRLQCTLLYYGASCTWQINDQEYLVHAYTNQRWCTVVSPTFTLSPTQRPSSSLSPECVSTSHHPTHHYPRWRPPSPPLALSSLPAISAYAAASFPATPHSFSLLSPITSHGFQASCKSGTATLYCCPDSAFLCSPCNSKAHAANKPPPATLAYPSARSASRTSLTSPARPMLMRKHGRHEGRWWRVADQQGLLLWLVLLFFWWDVAANGGQVVAARFLMSGT